MKNTKRRFALIAAGGLAAAALAVVLILVAACGNSPAAQNQFATVARGAIQSTIDSTGTISAQKTVDVGTQVSGQLGKLYVDFNDRVRKGQLLAELDKTSLELAVQSATADQLKAAAQYELKLKDYNNNVKLHEQALISDYDLATSKVEKEAAYAVKVSADVNLNKAKINLSYAVIRSPINGIIINRAVEEGQTVAASLSAPTLFTIAEDLASIQIKTYVPESDIGSIQAGQKATFTVTSYPDDTFSGRVEIIHLQSETVQNVVNYVVIVTAANRGQKLMPGMTATVTFIIEERESALLVPNAALQYKLTAAQQAEVKKAREERRPANSDGAAAAAGAVQGAPSADRTVPSADRTVPSADRTVPSADRRAPQGQRPVQPDGAAADDRPRLPANMKMLWGLDADGKLFGVPVKTGITDGKNTEIISDRVKEGDRFLTGSGAARASSPSNQRRGFGPF